MVYKCGCVRKEYTPAFSNLPVSSTPSTLLMYFSSSLGFSDTEKYEEKNPLKSCYSDIITVNYFNGVSYIFTQCSLLLKKFHVASLNLTLNKSKLLIGRKSSATGYVSPFVIPLSSCISFHLLWFF